MLCKLLCNRIDLRIVYLENEGQGLAASTSIPLLLLGHRYR